MPKEFSRVASYFLLHGGTISVEITGRRLGKGLEVPCLYTFTGGKEKVAKLDSLFNRINYYLINCGSYSRAATIFLPNCSKGGDYSRAATT